MQHPMIPSTRPVDPSTRVVSSSIHHRSWRAALLAGVLAGSCSITACGESETLPPPDGEECTVGVAIVDGQVNGTPGAGDCTILSEAKHRQRLAQSWTLQADAGRMYIVRLNPVGVVNGMDVMAIARGPGGRPQYATLGTYTYQETGESVDDSRSTELLLPADRDQELSIRIESDEAPGTASYALSVTSCPIRMVELEVAVDSIPITGTCQLRAYPFATAPVDVAVLGFRAVTTEPYTVGAERQDGTLLLRGFVAGPGVDVAWTHTGHLLELIGAGAALDKEFGVDSVGTYTFVVAKPVGSPVLFSARVSRSAALPGAAH